MGKSSQEEAKHTEQLKSEEKIREWEECKRLQKRIEGLRTQVNKKNQELMQCKREMDKLKACLTSSQTESNEYTKTIKKLNDKLQKATCKSQGTLDLAKVYISSLLCTIYLFPWGRMLCFTQTLLCLRSYLLFHNSASGLVLHFISL